MHGHGWAEDWAGRYIAGGLYLRRDALRREFGFDTLEDALAARLRRVSGIPPRGALVTTDQAPRWVIGAALGLSLGTRAAFVGKSGVVTLPIDRITGAYLAK
jgi:hypothetical protein